MAFVVVLVLAAGFGLITNRIMAEEYAAGGYESYEVGEFAIGNYDSYEAVEYAAGDYDSYQTADSVIVYIEARVIYDDFDKQEEWVNVIDNFSFFNPAFPPSRFNREYMVIGADTGWAMWGDFPERVKRLSTGLDPSTPEGEAFRLIVSYQRYSPMPEGWYITHAQLGGWVHHLFHEFETHEIMLHPYSLVFEYVAVDVSWSYEAELSMMRQADLLFGRFEELLAVSFRVQKVDRAEGMTNYKNAQLTRERVQINGVDMWCHEDRVFHLIPFYPCTGDPLFISVTFPWIPAGYTSDEVSDIVSSLVFDIIGLSNLFVRVGESWLQYGSHVYTFHIELLCPIGERGIFILTKEIYQELVNKAEYLFDHFDDLMNVTYFFDMRVELVGLSKEHSLFYHNFIRVHRFCSIN